MAQTTWVVSFIDRTVKLPGINDVIAAHIDIPRYLPPAHYYMLKIPRPLNVNGFNWVWSYLNGTIDNSIPLSPEDGLEALLYLEFFRIGEASWHQSAAVKIPSPYPALKLVSSVLSRNHPHQEGQVIAPEYISKYVKLFTKAGYLWQLLETKDSITESVFPLPEKLSNYLRMFNPADIDEYQPMPSYKIIHRGNFREPITLMIPILGNIYILSTMFGIINQTIQPVNGVPIPEEALRYITNGIFVRRSITIIAPTRKAPIIQIQIFIAENGKMWIAQKGIAPIVIPWHLYIVRDKSRDPPPLRNVLSPITAFPPFSSTGEKEFLLGSVRVSGYPTVFKERSAYMRAMPDEKDVVVIKEDPSPPLLYAWNYINGLDNRLDLNMTLSEAVRIFHYLNYFDVDLQSDLYDGFLHSLCGKMIMEGGILSPPERKSILSEFIGNIRMIKDRKALLVFHASGNRSCPVDQAVAALLERRVSPPFGHIEGSEIFTLGPFEGMVRSNPDVGKKGGNPLVAIYDILAPNGARIDLPYPVFGNRRPLTGDYVDILSIVDISNSLMTAATIIVSFEGGRWAAAVSTGYGSVMCYDMVVAEIVPKG